MTKYTDELSVLFEYFEANHVDYIIPRNYTEISQGQTYDGKDVDICVRRKDLKIIHEIMTIGDFIRIPINPFSDHRSYIKFVPGCEKMVYIHLHINGMTGAKYMYQTFDELFENNRTELGFPVPSYSQEYMNILCHCIIDHHRFKDKYRKRLGYLRDRIDNLIELQDQISQKFGKNEGAVLVHELDNDLFDMIELDIQHLVKAYEKRYKNRYLKLFRTYGLGALWKIKERLTPKPLISFIGMDGSGKTTTSKKFESILKDNNLKVKRIYTGRGKNNILPIRSMGKTYNKLGGKSSLGKKTSFSLIHTLAAPIFTLDLLLRYWFVVYPARLKNHIVITDRYSSDILLMNKVPTWIKALLYKLFPQPTIIFYLHNDIDTLVKRKGDHPKEDLIRQRDEFNKVFEIMKCIKIKTKSKQKTIDEVFEQGQYILSIYNKV